MVKTLIRCLLAIAPLSPFPAAAAPNAETQQAAGTPDAGPLSEAAAAYRRGDYESALALATAAAKKMEADPGVPRPEIATAWVLAGQAETKRARHDSALSAYQKGLALIDKSTDPKHWALTAVSVAGGLERMGKLAPAHAVYSEIIRIREKEFGALAPETAEAYSAQSLVLQGMQRYPEAEDHLRRALAAHEASGGKDSALVRINLNNLAALLITVGRPADAEPLIRRAIAISEAAGGVESEAVADSLHNLGVMFLQTRRPADAVPVFRRVLAIWDKPPGKSPAIYASCLSNLTQALRSLGRGAEAEPLIRRTLELQEKAYGKDHPVVATHLNDLGTLLAELKRCPEAEPVMRRAVEIYLTSTFLTGRPDPNLRPAGRNYTKLLMEMGDSEEKAWEKLGALISAFNKKLRESPRDQQPKQPASPQESPAPSR